MNVILTGGGTMGPVTPLLAVVEAWRQQQPDVKFLWVGTPRGPERALVERYGIPFLSLPVARFPRYVSIEWLTFPFLFLAGFIQSIRLIRSFQPQLIASAGGFTSVPITLAGWFFFVPSWLHQQDVQPLLTSRLLAPLVDLITVTFEQTVSVFAKQKTRLLGNPVRASMLNGSVQEARDLFRLDVTKPTVLVFGGGTGSTWINQAIEHIAPTLLAQANVIQLTGRRKMIDHPQSITGWFQAPFLYEEMKHAYAVADVVVSRAGMGSMTELAALSKATILVPLPSSAQERNAEVLGDCVEVIHQTQQPEELLQMIEALLEDATRRTTMGQALHRAIQTDVADELVTLLEELAKSKHTP